MEPGRPTKRRLDPLALGNAGVEQDQPIRTVPAGAVAARRDLRPDSRSAGDLRRAGRRERSPGRCLEPRARRGDPLLDPDDTGGSAALRSVQPLGGVRPREGPHRRFRRVRRQRSHDERPLGAFARWSARVESAVVPGRPSRSPKRTRGDLRPGPRPDDLRVGPRSHAPLERHLGTPARRYAAVVGHPAGRDTVRRDHARPLRPRPRSSRGRRLSLGSLPGGRVGALPHPPIHVEPDHADGDAPLRAVRPFRDLRSAARPAAPLRRIPANGQSERRVGARPFGDARVERDRSRWRSARRPVGPRRHLRPRARSHGDPRGSVGRTGVAARRVDFVARGHAGVERIVAGGHEAARPLRPLGDLRPGRGPDDRIRREERPDHLRRRLGPLARRRNGLGATSADRRLAQRDGRPLGDPRPAPRADGGLRRVPAAAGPRRDEDPHVVGGGSRGANSRRPGNCRPERAAGTARSTIRSAIG